MHSKDFLAQELRKAGLEAMADKAATGWYHDFLSPLDVPAIALADDLERANTPPALALRIRHLDGEFDATTQESDEWMASEEGQEAIRMLANKS